ACNTMTDDVAEAMVECPKGQYCSGPRGYQEVCVAGDVCDPSDPGSCGAAQGCFLRLNDRSDGVLTVCLPLIDKPLEDGAACVSSGAIHLNACRPGSSCWGPARVPPSRWQDTDWSCRRSCTTSATSSGAEIDAG